MDTHALSHAPIGRLLLKYSTPTIVGMVVASLYTVVDRIFIGRIPNIGAHAISGVGVTLPITTVVLAFSMLVGLGATANMSLCLGREQKEEAAQILGNAVTLSILLAVLLTVLGLVFCDSLLLRFGASPDTLPFAKEYIVIILCGTIFNMPLFALNHTIRADGSPVTAGSTMILGCVLNVILDPLFIFVFHLGIKGAAYATVLSQIIALLWVLYYYFGGRSHLKITRQTIGLRRSTVLRIISIGISPFSMQIATSLVIILLNNQLRLLGGDLAIGAYTIISSLSMLFMMAIFGLNQGAQPIIGYNYGARDFDRVKRTLRTALIAGTAYLSLGFIIVQCFPVALINLFNAESDELLTVAIQGVRTQLFTLPLLASCVLGSTFFQHIGKARVSMVLSLMRQCLLLIPLLYILPQFWGLWGVWLAQPVGDVLACILILSCVAREWRFMSNAHTNADQR